MSLLQITLNVLLSLALAFVAGGVLLVYAGRVSRVAEQNAAQHEECERRWAELKRLLRRAEQRLAPLGNPDAPPERPEIDQAWDELCRARTALSRSADPGELFLPSYASDTDALLALGRRPIEAIRFGATMRRLRQRGATLDRARHALDDARRTIDDLEGIPAQLNRAWRKMHEQWQLISREIEREIGIHPACARAYQHRAIRMGQALERLEARLDEDRPVDDALHHAFEAQRQELESLVDDYAAYADVRVDFDARWALLQDVLELGEPDGEHHQPLPALLQDAINALMDRAQARTTACDFGNAVAWLVTAEVWRDVARPLAHARQAAIHLQHIRARTLSPARVDELLQRWDDLEQDVHDRWLSLARGMEDKADPAQPERAKEAVAALLRDMRAFYDYFQEERFQTREFATDSMERFARTLAEIDDTAVLNGDPSTSLDVLRQEWEQAADNPRRLAELAEEAAHKSQIFASRHASLQTTRRQARQIIRDAPALYGRAQEKAKQWHCLAPRFQQLEEIMVEIRNAWAIARNGTAYDEVQQALEWVIDLGQQAHGLARAIDETADELSVEVARINRSLLYVRNHLLPHNPARVRPQAAYVMRQIESARRTTALEMTRQELRRALNLVDEIVTHFVDGQDGHTGR